MFDFSKLKMTPSFGLNFDPPATDAQIEELEQYIKHSLPENLKIILKNYNGGQPSLKYFHALHPEYNTTGAMKLSHFYFLDDNTNANENIWWVINYYSEIMGPNTLPFADDGLQQIYYIKWVNDIPQVWFLAYLDLDEPETFLVKDSFDELLSDLYA